MRTAPVPWTSSTQTSGRRPSWSGRPCTSTPWPAGWPPVHTHDRAEPARPGEVVPVDVALLPHATRFRAGDQLQLQVGLRWPVARDPLRGQFPTAYLRSPTTRCTLHTGEEAAATLLV